MFRLVEGLIKMCEMWILTAWNKMTCPYALVALAEVDKADGP